jgi:glycosyltransferase involved in cell wall biosynthesis
VNITKHILHILGERQLPHNPDASGVSGVVRAALELARAQVVLGHKVTVAAIGGQAWSGEWHGVQLVGLVRQPWARVCMNGRVLDLRAHLPYVQLTHRHSYDVAHGHLYSYLRFLRARRRVIHIHADPFYKGSHNEGIDMKAADFLCMARYSHAQVAVSHFVAGELERGLEGRGSVHVVPNGVDSEYFDAQRWRAAGLELRTRWGARPDHIVLLYAGAIVPEKGVIQLARAFARLAADIPGMHLALVGASALWGSELGQLGYHDDYERAVREALRVPAEAGRVHFLGKLPVAQMPAAYAASDVTVVPSVWCEAFGLVALEALASGRPVIASQTGGLVEIVNEQNGRLVPPGDEQALEAALSNLASNADLRKRLGAAARRQALQFSWEAAARQLDAIYQDISARKVA